MARRISDACGLKFIHACDSSNGTLSISSKTELALVEVHKFSNQSTALVVEGKIGKSVSRLICFDFSTIDEATKKTVAGELE